MTAPPPERDDDSNVNVDAAFNQIVSNWGETASVEDLPTESTETTGHQPDVAPDLPGAGWSDISSKVGGNTARSFEPAEEPFADDDEFVPPEPPPLTMPSKKAWFSWIPVVCVPIFFVVCAFVWRDVPEIFIVIAACLFVLGAAMLIAGLGDGPSDPGDDGARL